MCDAALELLSMPELPPMQLRVVDVARSDALIARYGERVPVLEHGSRELAWPFGLTDVRTLLAD